MSSPEQAITEPNYRVPLSRCWGWEIGEEGKVVGGVFRTKTVFNPTLSTLGMATVGFSEGHSLWMTGRLGHVKHVFLEDGEFYSELEGEVIG